MTTPTPDVLAAMDRIKWAVSDQLVWDDVTKTAAAALLTDHAKQTARIATLEAELAEEQGQAFNVNAQLVADLARKDAELEDADARVGELKAELAAAKTEPTVGEVPSLAMLEAHRLEETKATVKVTRVLCPYCGDKDGPTVMEAEKTPGDFACPKCGIYVRGKVRESEPTEDKPVEPVVVDGESATCLEVHYCPGCGCRCIIEALVPPESRCTHCHLLLATEAPK